MAHVKIIEEKLGGGSHHLVRVFTSIEKGLTMAKCGDMIFDEKEMPEIREKLKVFANVYEKTGE